MGESRKRKQKFFEAHPYCAFCGGSKPTETEDHQPARVFFKERQWPEGFVFPACQKCNGASRESERLLALFVHGDGNQSQSARYREHILSINREYPGLIDSLFPKSNNEKRDIIRRKGLTKPEGFLKDFHLVKINQEFWKEHIDMVFRKIFLGLHYQCYGNPLPLDGGMWIWVSTNADIPKLGYLSEILEQIENLAIPRRNKKYLNDQFSVRWSSIPDCNSGIFVIHLHEMFIATGITTDNIKQFDESGEFDAVTPFHWE